MSHYGAPLNGVTGSSASAFEVGGADLGIPFIDVNGATCFAFGDTFAGNSVGSEKWRSPVLLYSPSNPNDDIRFNAGSGAPPTAKQIFDYQHDRDNNTGFGVETSRIPNSGIVVNGRMFLQYTSYVNKPNAPFLPVFAGIAYSDDNGNSWPSQTALSWNNVSKPDWPYVWSFAGVDSGHLYIFGIPWGASNSPGLRLFRCNAKDILNPSPTNYENWVFDGESWQWKDGSFAATPIFGSQQTIYNISVQKIGQKWVMSYFDVGNSLIATRTADHPDGVWTEQKPQVWAAAPSGIKSFPQLYGGFIHPKSVSSNDLTLIVSQWNTGAGQPYWTMQFDGIVA